MTDTATLPGLSGATMDPDSTAPAALWRGYEAGRGWVCGYIELAVSTGALTAPPSDRVRAHNALFAFDLDKWDPVRSVSRNMRKTLLANSILELSIYIFDDNSRAIFHYMAGILEPLRHTSSKNINLFYA